MKVYKYRYGSKRDLDSLEQDYFYVPHPSSLNDPFENLFDENQIYKILDQIEKILEKSTSNIQQQLKDLCQRIRTKIGIFSLSKTERDELLWSYYADSHRGFCIEYDLEKLTELNKITASFDIDYKEKIPNINLETIIAKGDQAMSELLRKTSGGKSISWNHEKEFRICIEPYGNYEYDYRAVKAIYFGLRMPKKEKDLLVDNEKLPDHLSKVSQEKLMEALKGRGIKYYQMLLKPNSYDFGYIEVEDLYMDVPKYKSHIKPLDKSLIDYNGYGWSIEPRYFDKVAEIICREPYYYKLNSIHVSKEQSISRNEPIIFAGFFKAENDWSQIKKYLTLSEIDQIYNRLDI
jgi:hypothetical protein